MAKFYEYDQNNSGGSFEVNENVTIRVWIEAESANVANARAEDKGIYFDGCSTGQDCSCCGDRWYSASGEPDFQGTVDELVLHIQNRQYNGRQWAKTGQPYAYIYTADGEKTVLVNEGDSYYG